MLRKFLIPILCVIYPLVIYIIPALAVSWPLFYLENLGLKLLWLAISPLVFILSFILIAGILSLPAQKAIIAGKFPRDIKHPIYGMRRLYGLCWTAVYYSGPIYYLCLIIPLFKKILLRLFGYRGSIDVVIYPDTWIRDLPLLNIEPGVYLANKSTIGTNTCLLNGKIIVGKITIKQGAMIGHLAAIAQGTTIGEKVELGAGCLLGMNIFIGNNSSIGAGTVISHYTRIGSDVIINHSCYIGSKVTIGNNIKLMAGTIISEKTTINTQEEADAFIPGKNYHISRL